ncbi:MAG: gliding motility-associated C-terminal domain-containing protein [Bacteroidota bacterium]
MNKFSSVKWYVWPSLLMIFWLSGSVHIIRAQPVAEICDNGLDDDGDGRIDLLDPDCACPPFDPPSLIPNPSFEDTTCCPGDGSQMNCTRTWIQASSATTDLLHTCGWMGWLDAPPPLPIPDGDACLGFLNGVFRYNGNSPNWKEYAGACLLSPLQPGVEYKFQFYLGFSYPLISPPIDITFFGTDDCSNLPFGGGNSTFGCPTNGDNWYELGVTRVRGTREWKEVEITVTPNRKIEAIAIGPSCLEALYAQSPYYFLDKLTLNTATSFGLDIGASDQLCAEDVYLSVVDLPDFSYQWYKDGIALPGEDQATLVNLAGPGNYQVYTINPSGACSLSDSFPFFPPEASQQMDITICQGESYWFGGQYIDQAGHYTDTLKTATNCDSVLRLNLDIFEHEPEVREVKVWPGEQIFVGPARLSDPGWHEVQMYSRSGCDSTAIIDLKFFRFFAPSAFTPNDDGVNDRYFISGGADIQALLDLQIYNRWGKQVYQGAGQNPASGWDGKIMGRPASEGVYMYKARVVFTDGKMRERSGSLTLLR